MSEKRRVGFGFFKFLVVLIVVLVIIAAVLFVFTGFYVTDGSVLGLDQGVYWYYKGPGNMDVPFVLSPGEIAEGQGLLGGLVNVLRLENFVKEHTIQRFPLPDSIRDY